MTVLSIYRQLRRPFATVFILTGTLALLLFYPWPSVHAATASAGAMFTETQSEPESITEALNFRVWLGDREIGTHAITLSKSGSRTDVLSEVLYNVKVLFVNVFNYEHTSNERWIDGCLAAIKSSTKENGAKTEVNGEQQANNFHLQVNAQPDVEYDACIGTYAYWDEQLIQRDALMNAQTGDLDPATVELTDPAPLPRIDRRIPGVRLYAINTEEALINLWYSSEGKWLALQTDVDGKPLVYLNETIVTD